MEDDVLARVISAEKEIQECLEVERNKARAWLEGVQKEAEEEFARQMEQARDTFTKSVEQAKTEAEAEAAKIVRNAQDKSGQFLALGDETLGRIIIRRLDMILPE